MGGGREGGREGGKDRRKENISAIIPHFSIHA